MHLNFMLVVKHVFIVDVLDQLEALVLWSLCGRCGRTMKMASWTTRIPRIKPVRIYLFRRTHSSDVHFFKYRLRANFLTKMSVDLSDPNIATAYEDIIKNKGKDWCASLLRFTFCLATIDSHGDPPLLAYTASRMCSIRQSLKFELPFRLLLSYGQVRKFRCCIL